MMHFLAGALLGLLLLSPHPLEAQSLRTEESKRESEAQDSQELINQLLDLEFLMREEQVPYSTQTSPWGGALLPDPSYDPNYRVPEAERLYPPGYLEKRKKATESVR